MLKLLLLALGGAAGTLARFGTTEALYRVTMRASFPLGTLAVNVMGCLLIGYLNGLFVERIVVRDEYRIMLIAGFLGGFTTFSAFGWETTSMLHNREYLRAIGYLAASNTLGIAMAAIGYVIGHR